MGVAAGRQASIPAEGEDSLALGGEAEKVTLSAAEVVAAGARYLMDTYPRAPVVLVRGRGARVWDADGRCYLDFLSGISVNNVGHCHPRVVDAVRRQVDRLIHCSNLYHSLPQVLLAQRLAEATLGGQVFFCQSGAEAVETAVKLARKHFWRQHGRPARGGVLVFTGAFHGRTLAALAATGRYTEGFEPLPPGFVRVPFNNLGAAEQAFAEELCAVLVEPVQGEGGVIPATAEFLRGLRELCDRHGALLIFDEIQTGLGRTGSLFAYTQYGVQPDVLTLAKALGGGLPIGAVVARREVAASFRPGDHGSTFGGNPVACAAALATLDVLEEEELPARAARVGAYFRARLQELARRRPLVREVRGLGLMVGAELAVPAAPVAAACREHGLLVNCTAQRVLRFLPPLVVGEAEVDEAVAVLDQVLAATEARQGKG